MTQLRTRPLTDHDLDVVLAANNAEVPAVGALDLPQLRSLVGMAESALAAEVDGELAGFVIALPAGRPYASANYRWVGARYDDFVYVDRVAVLPAHRGRGVGHLLYDAVEQATRAPVVVAEVNTRPRNDASLAFHARRGFEPVGEAEPHDDGTRVVYLARRLDVAPDPASATPAPA
jgi:predicted GNAT superfamily acetyltransferase